MVLSLQLYLCVYIIFCFDFYVFIFKYLNVLWTRQNKTKNWKTKPYHNSCEIEEKKWCKQYNAERKKSIHLRAENNTLPFIQIGCSIVNVIYWILICTTTISACLWTKNIKINAWWKCVKFGEKMVQRSRLQTQWIALLVDEDCICCCCNIYICLFLCNIISFY